MKRILVFLLLLVFTIQITKSFWIISSFHINRDYIAKNICINRFDKIPTCKGQCFLIAELSKEQKENKANITIAEKDIVFIVPSSEETALTIFTIVIDEKQHNFLKTNKYTSFLFNFENPPELA